MAKPSNAWMTWKERTPFMPGPVELRARIAPDDASERLAGIRYLLLHELGHVLGETANAHPPWGPAGTVDDIDLTDYPFLTLSWKREGESLTTQFEQGRPGRLRYYQPPERRQPNEDMVRSYRWLGTTSFATLYSLNSIFDDFAEAFANYVHVVMLNEPFEIEIASADGDVVLRYGACWEEPRCARKKAFLDAYLQPRVFPASLPRP